MPSKLTVQNAEIRTASVEIKTLTVSGKQVTLAVFRQLRDVPLVNEDGTLRGSPWGSVNYHPDKCADLSEHLHVVWQQGSDLLRSAVGAPGDSSIESPVAGHVLAAAIRDGLYGNWSGRSLGALPNSAVPPQFSGLTNISIGPRLNRNNHDEYHARFRYNGVGFHAFVPSGIMSMMGQFERAEQYGDRRDWREVADDLPVDEYLRTWDTLCKLPQLFIAV
ncbi:hypothetical protein [Micromonospora sp. NPDC049107]|uniref:hypothetical protein n=1 Tax=unclassified Micromonospora TaxID=2617518 RepID=UPI0033F5790E